jgi:hypothetical protein
MFLNPPDANPKLNSDPTKSMTPESPEELLINKDKSVLLLYQLPKPPTLNPRLN